MEKLSAVGYPMEPKPSVGACGPESDPCIEECALPEVPEDADGMVGETASRKRGAPSTSLPGPYTDACGRKRMQCEHGKGLVAELPSNFARGLSGRADSGSRYWVLRVG